MSVDTRALHEAWLTDALRMLDEPIRLLSARELVSQVKATDAGQEGTWRTLAYAGLGDALIRSASSVMQMCADEDLGSAYVLARALVEQAITLAYLMICSDNEFKKWELYGQQKTYRLLDRSKQAGPVMVRLARAGVPEPDKVPGLAEALKSFTGKSGGEVTRWTDVNLDRRVQLIQQKWPDQHITWFLLMGLVNCYEIGAEVQHATSVGATIQHLKTLGDSNDLLAVARLTAALCATATGIAVGLKLPNEELVGQFEELAHTKLAAIVALYDQGTEGE